MFLKFIPILLLIYGCTNKLSVTDALDKAKQQYNDKQYNKAANLLRDLDSESAWGDHSLDTLTLLAKSTYLASKGRDRDKNLLESIQVCDLIIAHDPIYSIKNEVYMVKIRGYFDMVNFDERRCDAMAYKVFEAVQEYLKAAKEHKLMEIYNKHKAEIKAFLAMCRGKVTARAIAQSKFTSKPLAALAQLNAIEDDVKHTKKTPELHYNQLTKLIELKKNHKIILATLEKIYIASKKDLKWLQMAIDAIEHNKLHYKFSPTEVSKFEYYKMLIRSSYR
jgi:hypothetical protein